MSKAPVGSPSRNRHSASCKVTSTSPSYASNSSAGAVAAFSATWRSSFSATVTRPGRQFRTPLTRWAIAASSVSDSGILIESRSAPGGALWTAASNMCSHSFTCSSAVKVGRAACRYSSLSWKLQSRDSPVLPNTSFKASSAYFRSSSNSFSGGCPKSSRAPAGFAFSSSSLTCSHSRPVARASFRSLNASRRCCSSPNSSPSAAASVAALQWAWAVMSLASLDTSSTVVRAVLSRLFFRCFHFERGMAHGSGGAVSISLLSLRTVA
mmetsp:Transcript_8248/g.24626  ORF Transcript_8248/g.24626 Transcript_8248/m.24626 type:complete len:267 (-) Transcript_8248:660-1460(-)